MRPRLTIGMAHHTDFHGLYFTIQSLRLNSPEIMRQVEFVVVDNSPGTRHSEMIKGLLANLNGTVAGVQYVEMTSPEGTSPSRNKIFEVATGDYVLVLDCHVLLAPDALESLLRYYAEFPETNDIVSGPLFFDNLQSLATHFGNVWRGEMLGIWETAWQCNCSVEKGTRFAGEEGPNGEFIARDLTMERREIDGCHNCGESFPFVMRDGNFMGLQWVGHEKVLSENGYHMIGTRPETDVPFEVPGQGLGLFSCQREAWQGFHPDACGFGGEEIWIHEKFRRAGGKAIIIPQLKWVHRFGRPDGVSYPLTRWRKVRNYVLEFQQIDWTLDPIEEHFVKSGLMERADWDLLLSNPTKYVDKPALSAPSSCSTCPGDNAQAESSLFASAEEVYAFLKAKERDLNEHMPKLRELATGLDHVTEICNRREPTVAFLLANPKKFVSYNTEYDGYVTAVEKLREDGGEYVRISVNDTELIHAIEETDLLFIDMKHTYGRVKDELGKYAKQVRHYIVLHDTDFYGKTGEDGGPGLMQAIREFCRADMKWSVVYHTTQQYGLTVLSCHPEDRPPAPPLGSWKVLKTFAAAVGRYVASGGEKTDKDLFEARLDTCAVCVHRAADDRCSACGCFIEAKAGVAAEDCPLAYWPKKSESSEESSVSEGGQE